MDKLEKQMIDVVNRNYEIRALADRLNAISAKRKKRKGKK